MLPCVWCCVNWRMDSSLQFNDGIALCRFHLTRGIKGAEDLLPTAYLYTPACSWVQRTNCCLLAILPRADTDELGSSPTQTEPSELSWEPQSQRWLLLLLLTKARSRAVNRESTVASSEGGQDSEKMLWLNLWQRWILQFEVWQNKESIEKSSPTLFFPIYCPGIALWLLKQGTPQN